MSHLYENERRCEVITVSTRYPLTLVLTSLGALVATFMLASSDAPLLIKSIGFAGIIALFLFFIYAVHPWQSRWRQTNAESSNAESSNVIAASSHNCLHALEEAKEYIAGSLQTVDVFRLVTNRIADVMPLAGSALYLLDETRSSLRMVASDGSTTERRSRIDFESGDSAVNKCYSSGSVEFGATRPGGKGEDGTTSVAIPLCRETESFGVLHLYIKDASQLHSDHRAFLDAVAERVAPLVISSMSYEKTRANALTDATTDLPNERAFHLILENQIAEAHRNRGERPLTILTMDIKNFDDINKRYGHAAGDQVLNFTAITIRDSLRQMDFFARASNDEFLAILPTASKEISHEVIARVSTSFFGCKLKIAEEHVIEIVLNFGWAAFGEDGETSGQLLSAARLRKEQSKSIDPSKVLWFSREMTQ